MAMGMAEVIPGVSGGTIAFITGIYEKLLQNVRNVDGTFFKHLFKGRLKDAFALLDVSFLLFLLMGMFGGIVLGVLGVSYLLETFPTVLWSFFFGLILMSIFYILSKVEHLDIYKLLIFLAGAMIAFGICLINPMQGNDHPLYLIIAGSIAISALILPGISGSFMLLIMGMYSIVIPALKNILTNFSMDAVKIVVFFGIGCLIGLALFSRVLTWTFKKYHDQTLAILSGFMLGSLYKIWPWRHPEKVLNKETNTISTLQGDQVDLTLVNNEQYKILSEQLVSPSAYLSDAYLWACIAASVVGLSIVYFLWKHDRSEQ